MIVLVATIVCVVCVYLYHCSSQVPAVEPEPKPAPKAKRSRKG